VWDRSRDFAQRYLNTNPGQRYRGQRITSSAARRGGCSFIRITATSVWVVGDSKLVSAVELFVPTWVISDEVSARDAALILGHSVYGRTGNHITCILERCKDLPRPGSQTVCVHRFCCCLHAYLNRLLCSFQALSDSLFSEASEFVKHLVLWLTALHLLGHPAHYREHLARLRAPEPERPMIARRSHAQCLL